MLSALYYTYGATITVDTRAAQAHNCGGALPANHLALCLTYWTTTLLDPTVENVENQREASELPRRAGTLIEDEVATNRPWASCWSGCHSCRSLRRR